MARKAYGLLEDKVIEIFQNEKSFTYRGVCYKVLKVGKPRTSSGECKTDVYVLGQCSKGSNIELKISIKTRSSNEFQENKVTAPKMEAYFGIDWEKTVIQASKSLCNEFENRPLIYVTKHHPVKPDSITLGWKLEIASKPRSLSAPIPLTDKEIRDYVYKGTNQPIEKKNASVNGEMIINSGIAEFLLVTEIDELKCTSDVINQMELIDEAKISPTHLIFTANNYRTREDSADGPRPLAVFVKWTCIDNKLVSEIVYDSPLLYTGQNDIKPILLEALNKLGKMHPSEMDARSEIAATVKVLP